MTRVGDGEECGCGAPGLRLPCGCCAPDALPTPRKVENRPALPAIRYRVGTYPEFREAMLAAARRKPELARWTARRDDDWGVAVLDLWAYVADVLTFYQERAANEAFLRTATLRGSVVRLAALLDYRLGPGKAATAHLALALEKGKRVRVPAGLRVQSVPEQGEKPQKFEVETPLVADAALNALRAHAVPVAQATLQAGDDEAVLAAAQVDEAGVSPGDRLLVLTATKVEVKEAAEVAPRDEGVLLAWSPPLQAAGTEMRRLLAQHPLLGPSLPAYTFDPTPDTTKTGHPPKGWKKTTFNVGQRAYVELDGIRPDVKQGSDVVLVHPGGRKLLAVTGVAQDVREVGNVRVPFTRLDVKDPANPASATPVPSMTDTTKATLFVVGPKLAFASHVYPDGADAISGDKPVVVPLEALEGPAPAAPSPSPLAQAPPEPPTPRELLAPGRLLVLDDDSARPQVVTVTEAVPHGDGKHLRVSFSPPLRRSLDPATATLRANVVPATHGETVKDEALGDGDASRAFQRFELSRKGVTFVPRAGAPRGAASTLRVRVNGVLWKEVPTLVDASGDAQAYETRLDDDGTMRVLFGDNRNGARLPTGRKNVVATYRQGIGKEGNVRAGALRTLLDRPQGLKGAVNPLRAEGGADPETLENARRLAPMKVRTFGRVVSLRDVEDAALDFAGVTKAKASWAWEDGEQAVLLTVGGDPDAPLGEETVRALVDDLDARRDPAWRLRAVAYEDVPLRVAVEVEPDPRHDPETVKAAVRDALLGAVAYERMRFGEAVNLSDLYRAIHGAEGVVAARVVTLRHRDEEDRLAHEAPEKEVHPRLPILPTALASLRAEDVDVAIVESLAEEE